MSPSTKRQELYADLKRTVETLANETDTARQSELFCDYLRCASLFHNYSWGNQMMIWTQRPTATRVAGYHTWRKMGRHVKQGQKGIAIFAPMVLERKEAADPDGLVTLEKEQVWFRVVYVFDVAQTEGQPLPDLPTGCAGNLVTWSSACVHSQRTKAFESTLEIRATPRATLSRRAPTSS